MERKIFVIVLLGIWLVLGLSISGSAAFTDPISAECAVLMDTGSGDILLDENGTDRHLIASTTKILTALVVLETCGLDETVTVSAESAAVEGSSIYLEPGEQLSVRELLYGLLMESGNDAADALARHAAGSLEAFADRMNEQARLLGCENSHFENPHGLDGQKHYSCAVDLARITAQAMQNETFRQIVSTKTAQVGSRSYTNHNKLLWQYDGTLGVKTGYTMAAGRILVSCAAREGLELICVTISAPDDWSDHEAILDWAFSQYKRVTLPEKEDNLFSLPVVAGETTAVSVVPRDQRLLLVEKDREVTYRTELPKFVYAPVYQGEHAGFLTALVDGQEIGRIDLFYAASVEEDGASRLNTWEKIRRAWALAEKYGGNPLIYYTD